MADHKPKLSIITPSLNTGRFLQATIDSIFGQSYKDFEYIVVDGGSTDGTLDTLKKYPQIRVITEKASGYWDAMYKGLAVAQGEYVMNCSISDGYLDMDWFRKCVGVLDADKEVSLVWGLAQYMNEDGALRSVAFPQFHKKTAPQKQEFFYYWLASAFWLPEGNFCVRTDVFRKCLPPLSAEIPKEREFWITINFNFNAGGYLPFFLPVVANYGRVHAGQGGSKDPSGESRKMRRYLRDVKELRRKIFFGGERHIYRDGMGHELPYEFSRSWFLRTEILPPSKALGRMKSSVRRSAGRVLYALRAKGMIPDSLMNAVVPRH